MMRRDGTRKIENGKWRMENEEGVMIS